MRTRRLNMARDRRGGFTIMELIVACVVTSIALLAVHAVFHQAMAVEARAAVAWEAQATAESVADHFAVALERAVNLRADAPAVVARFDEYSGVHELTCYVMGAPGRHDVHTWLPIQQHRYRWPVDPAAGRFAVQRQTRWLAGADESALPRTADDADANADADADAGEDGDADADEGADAPADGDVRAAVNAFADADGVDPFTDEPGTIATGVSGLSIRFRPASDPRAPWLGRWNGMVGDVAILVIVQVGDAEAKRIVVPACDGLVERGAG